MDDYIAERARRIDASGIRKVFALAATLDNPVDFSIGQPDFDVPDPIKRRAIDAIRNGCNKYSQSSGDEQLRQKIADAIHNEFGWNHPAVLVTSGVSGGLLLAFMSLIDPGDEVIIPDPYFVIYKHLVNLLGGRCVFVDCYDDFSLPVDRLADCITDKTKLIIVNSPCNPSGMIYPAGQLRQLAEAAGRRGIIILSDEIYEKFSYDGPCPSIASFYDRSLVLRGFGKSYGMPGWRLGYAAAHPTLAPLVEQMTKIQQYTFVCAPRPLQAAAIAAMEYDLGDIIAAYRKKRDLLYEGLKDKFNLRKPQGAFYAFVESPVQPAGRFVETAVANNVLIIPGSVFSERDTHFRISYATSDEIILRGVEILRRIA